MYDFTALTLDDLSHLTSIQGLPESRIGDGRTRLLTRLDERGGCIVHGNPAESLAIEVQHAKLGLADTRRIFKHSLEHRLQFAGRRTDNPSTSDVAVCWSNASPRSSVRWRNSLSSRAFSMAMTAWAAKF